VDKHQPSSSLAHPAAAAAAQPCAPDAGLGERAEWQLALLRGIAEDGAAMLHIIRNQAEQAKWVGTGGDEMFERISRSVRQTMAFANKIEAEAKLTPEQHAAAYMRRVTAEARASLPKPDLAPVGRDTTPISEQDDPEGLADGPVRTDREHLMSGLHEKFGDPSVNDELNGRTYGEILRNILTDVGANTDLSVFTTEELSRVYAPVQMRRRSAEVEAGPVVGDGSPDPGGTDEAPRGGAPHSSNGHDPP
jgi:hypothetical protein